MKPITWILAILTLFFAALCYYLLLYADAGSDGLGTFFSTIICGILCLGCFAASILQLWSIKGVQTMYQLAFMAAISLPILFILWKVFYPKEFEVEVRDEVEVLE